MGGPTRRPVQAGAVLHYADPVEYDRRYASRTDDVTYYVRYARRAGGPVLEYGCGTGRLTLPLARAGVAVTGIDLSRVMLDRLATKLAGEPPQVRRNVTLRHGDMRTERLRGRFALVLAPFNTFQHLYTRDDVEAFLARAHHHLAPGGHLMLDVYLPRMAELDEEADGYFYDPVTQILRIRFAPDGSDELWLRQYFPQELELLLAHNGFEAIRMTADHTRAKLHADATSIVVACRRRG